MLDLHGDYKGESSKVPTVDSRSVVDTFQVNDIVARNSFSIDASMENGHTGGSRLFIRASYINHSCLANSDVKFVGDLIMVYAEKPISKGEEITNSYSGFILDSERRSERIKGVWKLDCPCPLCSAEWNESPEAREHRQKLVAKANIRTGNTTLSRYESKTTVTLVELIAREIEAAYDVPLYENLPLPGLPLLRIWFFMGTDCIDRDPAKAKQATIDYLRVCAFKVETLDDGKTRVYAAANSINPEPFKAQIIPQTLITTAITVRKLGQAQAAEDLIDFAKSVAHAFCGLKDDTVAKCLEANARGEINS